MLHYLKTQGIIVRRSHANDYGERITALTRKKGKITFLASGILRPNSKLSAACLPGNIVYLTFVKQKAWNLTGAKIVVPAALPAHDLSVYRLFSAVREMLDTLLIEDEPDGTLYTLLEKYVRFMGVAETPFEDKKDASIHFCITLLKHLGHFPDGTVCQHRGGRMEEEKTTHWHIGLGFVCKECASISSSKNIIKFPIMVIKRAQRFEKIGMSDITYWEKIIADVYSRVSDKKLLSLAS